MFHNVRLPEDFENGAEGGLGFRTSIVQMKSGREQRNIEWQDARGEWTIGYGVQYEEDINELFEFFMARFGRAHSFRFKDLADYSALAQPLGTGDGVETEFQLIRRYSSGGYNYDRTITKPVTGTVVVYGDAVEITSGWSVDTATGIITFDTAPADDLVLTVDFEFDVPVRFDVDRLPLTYEAFQVFAASGLRIVEVVE